MSWSSLRIALLGLIAGAIFLTSPPPAGALTAALKIAGTANTPSPGPCGADYANQCLGSNPITDCTCVEVSNATAKGAILGKGASTAELSITIDDGASTSSPGCSPILGSATVNNPKTELTLTLNIAGTDCESRKGGGIENLAGGFGIANASNLATGWGPITGTINKNTGAVSLKFTGHITPPPASVTYSGTFSGQSVNVDCPTPGVGGVPFPETGSGTLSLVRSSGGGFAIQGSVTLAGGSNPQCPAVTTCCFDGSVPCAGTAMGGQASFSCGPLQGRGSYDRTNFSGTWLLPLTPGGSSGPSEEGDFSLTAQ
jgi:hypothetical protein